MSSNPSTANANLDPNELEAALADLALALVEHIPSLRQMISAATKG